MTDEEELDDVNQSQLGSDDKDAGDDQTVVKRCPLSSLILIL